MISIVFLVLAGLAALFASRQIYQSLDAIFSHDAALLPAAEAESRRRLEDELQAVKVNINDLAFDHDADKISDADFEKLDRKLRTEAKRIMRLLDADVAPYRAKAEERLRARLTSQGLNYREAPLQAGDEVDAERLAPIDEESGLAAVLPEDVPEAARKLLGALVGKHLAEENPELLEQAKAESKAKAELAQAEIKAKARAIAIAEAEAADAGGRIDCSECGADNEGDALFCKKCGHSFAAAEDSSEENDSVEDAP